MNMAMQMSPDAIRSHLAEHPQKRARDISNMLGIGEAALLAAKGAIPISANLDEVMPALNTVGAVMALTRNASAVHEKTGIYENYRGGPHASMVINDDIDMRMFGRHWFHGFAETTETESGVRRSLQFFDAAGDAVHKVYAREGTDLAAWDTLVKNLTKGDPVETLDLQARAPVEAAKINQSKAEALRTEWAKLTDTHQFLRLVSKMGMNRLGAYRVAGAPFVTPLAPWALNDAIVALGDSDTEIMLFVGNQGCIQIHTGPINTVKPMGPWQNILDPGFNLHLRTDHVAELWAHPAISTTPAAQTQSIVRIDGLLLLGFGPRTPEAAILLHDEIYGAN